MKQQFLLELDTHQRVVIAAALNREAARIKDICAYYTKKISDAESDLVKTSYVESLADNEDRVEKIKDAIEQLGFTLE